MRDFINTSTTEVLYDITTNIEIKTKKFDEIINKNRIKRFMKNNDKPDEDIMEELSSDIKDFQKESLGELCKLAEDGDIEAQCDLGTIHLSILANIEKGIKWYNKAAQNGSVYAQYQLASLYLNGIFVDQDESLAFKWAQKAADQGSEMAILCVAICYEHGIGVEEDTKKAFEILSSIENEKKFYPAKYCLGIYYEKAIGVEKNEKKAFDLYKTCVNGGYDRGQFRSAICYQYGIGVKQDYKKAFNRYKKAMSNGNRDAKFFMGQCYENGIGTNVDYKKAFSIYEELTENKYEDAMYRLAYFYENGIGGNLDREKAFEIYNELASMGYEEAKFYLAQCDEERRIDGYKDEEVVQDIDSNYDEKIIDYEEIAFDAEQDELIEDLGIENYEEVSEEDEILFSKDLGINIFLEQTIYKQVKDNNLEDDLKRLVVKIDKCINSTNKALNFKSLGFKKFGGVGNNKIYGFDFNNKVNDSDRIIACFIEDYVKKNEFDFDRYINKDNEHKQGIILFSIAKHNDQEREALKVSKRIDNDFYKNDQFKSFVKKGGQVYKNINSGKLANKNDSGSMTFRALDFDDKNIVYQEILTNEQSKNINMFIQKSEPFILSGIAGSGKTLSTVNLIPDMVKKIKNNGLTGKILYVTFSNNLKEYVKEKVIENYYDLNEYIDIKTFEDVCTEIIYKYKNKKIDRYKIITQNSYSKNFAKFLCDLHRDTKDQHIMRFINKYQNEKNIIYSEIFGILKGSMYVNWDREEKNIVKSEYYIDESKKIVEDYKIFEKEDRKVLYSITEKYNEWLDKNGYYDINDIAFELQSLIKAESINYEYVVIDEVQDFTEVQIYMLFLLAKEQGIYGKNKTRKILLAGDPNQIINPTFFKIGRLTNLFYLNGYKYEVERLNENFRNSINIMKMNNIVNEIINEKLPARKEECRQREITKNNKTGLIEQVEASEENLRIIFREIDASAKVALIVSDEEKKEYLREKYGCNNAFTISEFKGKEFDNIIAYNILSDYADIYQEIYRKEHVKEGHYSYYFNRFYVSITRANYNLVLIEEKETEILKEIKEKLGDNLKYIQYVTRFKDLNLGELVGDSLDLFEQGMKFFYDDKFTAAKNYFSKSIEPNSNNLAKLCDFFEEDGKYEEKGDKLFEIGEYKLAQIYYQKAYQFSKFAIMYLYLENLSYDKQLREFYKYLEKEGINFSELFDEYACEFDKLNDILKHKIKKTENIASDVRGKMNNINSLFKNINEKLDGR